MKRQTIRYLLSLGLIVASGFAAWSWLRPYAWQVDSAAGCKIVETLISRDGDYWWANVHLKVNPGTTHNLEKPVRLETSSGTFHEPADSTFAGADLQQTTEIWFKFWLEPADLAGPLKLHLNDGQLVVRSGGGVPNIDPKEFRNFTSNRW